MSRGPASPLFKHLVNATKHRYTRGFGHVQKRAHRARETMIFAGFAHHARDLLVFNIKVCFSVRASFRVGPIYIYIYIYNIYKYIYIYIIYNASHISIVTFLKEHNVAMLFTMNHIRECF